MEEKDIFELEDDDNSVEEVAKQETSTGSSEDEEYLQDINNLVQDLIDKALSNVHEEIGEIRTLSALIAAKAIYAATKQVYKNFKKSMNNMLKAYKLSFTLAPTEDNFDILLTYKCMQHCTKYYKEECQNILNALDDCYNYIFSGHLMDFLMG